MSVASVGHDIIHAPVMGVATEVYCITDSNSSKSSHRWESISQSTDNDNATTHLVERSCVVEAAFPNLIHSSLRSCGIRAPRIGGDRLDCPATDTGLRSSQTYNCSRRLCLTQAYLVLFREVRLKSVKEFTRPSAVATQAVGPDLLLSVTRHHEGGSASVPHCKHGVANYPSQP